MQTNYNYKYVQVHIQKIEIQQTRIHTKNSLTPILEMETQQLTNIHI